MTNWKLWAAMAAAVLLIVVLLLLFAGGGPREGFGDEDNRVTAKYDEGKGWKVTLTSSDGKTKDLVFEPGPDEIAIGPESVAVSEGGKRIAVRRGKAADPFRQQVEIWTNTGVKRGSHPVAGMDKTAVHDSGRFVVFGGIAETHGMTGRVAFHDEGGAVTARPDFTLGLQYSGRFFGDRFILLTSVPGSLEGAVLAVFNEKGAIAAKSDPIPIKANAPFTDALEVRGAEIRVRGYKTDDSGRKTWVFNAAAKLVREE